MATRNEGWWLAVLLCGSIACGGSVDYEGGSMAWPDDARHSNASAGAVASSATMNEVQDKIIDLTQAHTARTAGLWRGYSGILRHPESVVVGSTGLMDVRLLSAGGAHALQSEPAPDGYSQHYWLLFHADEGERITGFRIKWSNYSTEGIAIVLRVIEAGYDGVTPNSTDLVDWSPPGGTDSTVNVKTTTSLDHTLADDESVLLYIDPANADSVWGAQIRVEKL